VINSKTNAPSQSSRLPQTITLIKDHAAIGLADSTVEIRAYQLYELRGKIDGFAQRDWYKAENALRASIKQSVADTNALNFSKALHETRTV
jgi:hypothetical protein